MKNQIKYSQIYAEVLTSLGEDLNDSIWYVPKKVIVRMWKKLPNTNYGSKYEDVEIIYDL